MITKITTLTLGAILSMGLFSCKKEESSSDDKNNATASKCSDTFKNQDAKGENFSKSFSFVQGSVEASAFDADKIIIDLFAESYSNSCSEKSSRPRYAVQINVPDSIGTYSLGVLGDYSASFIDNNPDGEVNIYADVAECGTVEITSITKGGVKGKITVSNTDSYLNGNFSADFCTSEAINLGDGVMIAL